MSVVVAARRWRPGSMYLLAVGLVVVAAAGGAIRDWVAAVPELATSATIFCGVFVQALPFLALGVIISGLVAAFVSADRLARWLPKRQALAVLTAGAAGSALPGCECGSLMIVVPPALDARTEAPRVVEVATDSLREPYPPLPAGRAPLVSLPDVLQRVSMDTAGTLNDRLITVEGFTRKSADGGVDLARIVIFCCAADGQLARIRLAGPAAAEAASMPETTWVRVEGTVPARSPETPASTIPLVASSVTRIEPPKNTYTYW